MRDFIKSEPKEHGLGQQGCPTLSDCSTLIQLALEKKMVSPEEEAGLQKWWQDPGNWR